MILSVYKDDEEIDIKKVKDSLEAEDNMLIQDIIDNVKLSGDDEEYFHDCIKGIEEARLNKREKEIIQILSILDDEQDRDKIEALTIEFKKIMEQKEAIKKSRR
jgi:DNA primase